MQKTALDTKTVAVVGLGYVGLPLAVEFGKILNTIGYDLSEAKLAHYRRGQDPTGGVSDSDMRAAVKLAYTGSPSDLAPADIFIVAVPTPVDDAHQPDFSPLISACGIIAPHMKKGAIVIFESTVYPGATEEDCMPVLERESGLKCGVDFFVGYSPERINPGDKQLNHLIKAEDLLITMGPAKTHQIVQQRLGQHTLLPVFHHTDRAVAFGKA